MKTNPPAGHPKPARADVPGTRPMRARAQGPLLFELWAPVAAPQSLAPSWVERTAISREMQMTASLMMGRSGKRPQINTYLWERTWKKKNFCTAMTNTEKLPSQKALFIFKWAQLPVRDWNSQNKIQDHSFLFIHKSLSTRRGRLGKGKNYVFLFLLFLKEIQISQEKKRGEWSGAWIQGRKDFWDSYENHSGSMNTTVKIKTFFKKSITGTLLT